MSPRARLSRLLEQLEGAPRADPTPLLAQLEGLSPADVADFFEDLGLERATPLFLRLREDFAAAVLIEMHEELQKELLPSLSPRTLGALLDRLSPDDAADIYNLLDPWSRNRVLTLVDPGLARQVLKLAAYEEESAGGIMTPEFVAVREDETLGSALAKVKEAEDLETDQVYVVDAEGHLRGVISLQEILHQGNQDLSVREVMDSHVYSVHDKDDQEEVLRQASHYGLNTVPVLDERECLVGIVTGDDIDFVQEEEAREDIFRMAGTLAKHPTKLSTSRRVFLRLPVLIITVLTCLLIAKILELLVPATSLNGNTGIPRLAAMKYLPLVIAMAGNVGTIVNAIVVRGLATSELEKGHLLQPLFEEFKVGLGIGVFSATLTLIGVGFLENWSMLGWSVALALLLSPVVSGLAGFMIPLLSHKLGKDPALTGPLVTNLNDLAGSALYVLICLILLP